MATALRYSKGRQFVDTNGLPVAAGQLQYFVTGTTQALETYSDSAGVTPNTEVNGCLVLDGAGRLQEDVYIAAGYNADEYLYYSSGNGGAIVSPWPALNIQAPVSYTAPQLGFAPPLTNTVEINQSNSPYTLSIAQLGSLVIGSTASGALQINLPPAKNATPGQGYWIFKPVGVQNLTLMPNGSDQIEEMTSYSITRVQSLMLVSDGTMWRMPFDTGGAPGDHFWYTGGSTPPADALVENGAAVSRVTFARLFQVIGTTYGAGDGSTTFNLPLVTGYFIRGFDTLGTVDPSRVFGSTQLDGYQDHTHFTVWNGAASGTTLDATHAVAQAYSGGSYVNYSLGNGTGTANAGLSSGSTVLGGTGSPGSENRPKNIAFLPCIKF